MSGFKEKRSVCQCSGGDEEGMVEAEWEEEYKKTPKTSWAVCLSQQQSEKLIREKKMWVGKHSTGRGDRCRNREREERFRESQRGKERQEDEARECRKCPTAR